MQTIMAAVYTKCVAAIDHEVSYEIWASHGDECSDYDIIRCNIMLSGRYVTNFQKNFLASSSG
jgi:hypothetical protein